MVLLSRTSGLRFQIQNQELSPHLYHWDTVIGYAYPSNLGNLICGTCNLHKIHTCTFSYILNETCKVGSGTSCRSWLVGEYDSLLQQHQECQS